MSDPKTPPKKISPGAALLAQRSRAAEAKSDHFAFVLVVNDNPQDLRLTSRVMKNALSPQARILTATTLGQTLDQLIEHPTIDLIFLNDHLAPGDNALTTIPFIRRVYAGPIIVDSGAMTARRAQEVYRAGAAAAVHLDQLDSLAMAEVLKTAAAWQPKA